MLIESQVTWVQFVPFKDTHASADGPLFWIDFSKKIQCRGEDFEVSVHTGYDPNEADDPLCQAILEALFGTDRGVMRARVLTHRIIVFYSSAASYDGLESQVRETIRTTGGDKDQDPFQVLKFHVAGGHLRL